MSAFSCRRSPAIDMKRPTTRACQTLQSGVAFRFCAVHQSRNEDFLVRNIPLFGSLALDLMNGRHIPRFISSSRHCPRPLGSQLDSSPRSLLQRLAGSWQHFEGSLTCTPHLSYARNTKLMRLLEVWMGSKGRYFEPLCHYDIPICPNTIALPLRRRQ